MIECVNLTSKYADGTVVLHDLSFKVEAGEQVGLIGANGAGKSTLLKSMLGLIETEGVISFDGKELCKKNLADIRKMVGYVLQDSDNQMFMPKVIDDMVFGPVNYGISRADAEKKAEETLEKLGIAGLKNKQNHKLSGGEKRMAAVATILTMEPEIMLLDEPSAALDPHNRRNLINILNVIPVTKIIASHDLDMVLETCNRVILINDGKIVADGKATDILSDKTLLEENGLELPLCMAGVPAFLKKED
ncbi:MAG: energy-coupling factor ABC transporter ATP-binding protein [Clostridia bacterium]|nr:energy-coupling factor ABC transporter ATP-binding protein [Clostridia bacterium]